MLRKFWCEKVTDNDVIQFVVLPAGGGGSNIGRFVATIAVMAFAAWAPAGLFGMTAGTLGAGAVSGAIGLVGSALVNAILPATAASMGSGYSTQGASPTYSVSAQGNSARIGSPIPVQYGRLRAYPDFAAQPYVEYAGNEQYLYQLFCIGQGYYNIEQIRIEDTPIGNFKEVTTEIVKPGSALTLFPANVETSSEVSGQELPNPSVQVTVIPSPGPLIPDREIRELTPVYLGPFVANSSGTYANKLAVDIVLPRGLFRMNKKGHVKTKSLSFRVQAQEIDNSTGVATGSWVTLGNYTITKGTTTPQRLTYRYSVAKGRYRVRVARTDEKDTANNVGHDISWAGLKAYLVSDKTFPGMTLLAVRIRATNNISSAASRKVNVIATRMLPTWNPTSGWSGNVATRNPAWAIADILRSKFGGRLIDSYIDLDSLRSLSLICDERKDYFDYRFDSKTTVWDAITTVGLSCRTKPYMQGGLVRLFRDQKQTVPVGMFSMRNIVKNSFSVNYVMPTDDTADAVEVEYYDYRLWSYKTVMAKMPDSEQENPITLSLNGITNREQAYREGMYQAACNRYRRRIITFTTGMEGFIPSIGDLCYIQHDMPQWGQSASVKSYSESSKVLVLSEPLKWKSGQTHYISLRRYNGTVNGPISATRGGNDNEVILAESPDFQVRDGAFGEATHVSFGWGDTWSIPAICTGVSPKSMNTVELTFVGESDAVHTAETGVIPPEPQYTQLDASAMRPKVTGLIAVASVENTYDALLSWEPSPGATTYYIEQSSDLNTWTRCGDTSSTSYTCTALGGAMTYFRVAAFNMAMGDWSIAAYSIGHLKFWSADDTTSMWSDDDTFDMWNDI